VFRTSNAVFSTLVVLLCRVTHFFGGCGGRERGCVCVGSARSWYSEEVRGWLGSVKIGENFGIKSKIAIFPAFWEDIQN